MKTLSYKKNRFPRTVFTNPVHFLAFGLGSGCTPFAPGTFGTVAAIPLYLLLNLLSFNLYLAVIIVSFALGVYLCGKTCRDLQVHDHSGIVWDEFVGYWATMIAAPQGWQWPIVGFVLFRFFDVLKPFPITYFDKHMGGGFGVMLDDVLAAVYAGLCLQGLALLL